MLFPTNGTWTVNINQKSTLAKRPVRHLLYIVHLRNFLIHIHEI